MSNFSAKIMIMEKLDLREIFTIPLFRNFTQKMQEEVMERLEYRTDHYAKGETIIRQGTVCNYLHILLKGKLNVDVIDVSGGEVRVETIRAPRTFATPHIFAQRNLFPATFTVVEDVTLLRATKDSVFALMNTMPLFLQNFLCVSASCNKCTMTRLRVLTFRGIRNRFIYYLFDNIQDGSDEVELEHNQAQLAEYFGVTRPALVKEIHKLVEEGHISLSRGKVKILNKHALSCML
jgi:CRP-like cAMP-binding protein